MRIAMHVDGPIVRGNERQAVLIAAGLAGRGHRVAVSCRAGGPVEAAMRAAGVPVTAARPGGDADPWNALRFVAWLRRERPDALLLTSWKRLFGASLAGRAARVPRIVFRLGGPQRIPPSGPSAWKYRRAFDRYVDRVVVNSRALGDRVAEMAPAFDPARVDVVHNAVVPAPLPPPALGAATGAAPHEVVLLAVGTLAPHKGFDVLIRAVAGATSSAVRLAIAGGGPAEADLRALAAELGVEARVHLLGERADVPALLAGADAFVLPSRRDSMANALLEAMAAGVPCVAADFMGTDEALAPRAGRPAAGWIVPAGDAAALGEALDAVAAGVRAGDAEVAARSAEAAWRVRNWFTVERMLDGYEATLRGEGP
jgi:glycosyltransferase involved in cell wall biosynthesis